MGPDVGLQAGFTSSSRYTPFAFVFGPTCTRHDVWGVISCRFRQQIHALVLRGCILVISVRTDVCSVICRQPIWCIYLYTRPTC